MKLSEELRCCLQSDNCQNLQFWQKENKTTCRRLLQAAYEQVKRYEDIFPCGVGDKLYYPVKAENRIVEFEIVEIQIFKDEKVFFDDSDNLYHVEDFGKTVFLTREQAEAEIKKNEEVEEMGNGETDKTLR